LKPLYLNLKKSDLKKCIYRIVPYDRLIELFQRQENTLVKPVLWEDTFENFAIKAKLQTQSGEVIQYNVHELMYGQCWTLEKSSDAMWRIYSSERKGIRIKTTIEKLLDSLASSTINTPHSEHCIGKVEYLKSSRLVRSSRSTFNKNGEVTFGSLFRSLLLKRKAFKHENEVRLMFLDWSENSGIETLYKYPIEPNYLIDEIMIDPRVSDIEYKEIENDIRKNTGFTGKIKKSLLYRLPEELTFDIHELKT
jgi:hypothetical protein